MKYNARVSLRAIEAAHKARSLDRAVLRKGGEKLLRIPPKTVNKLT